MQSSVSPTAAAPLAFSHAHRARRLVLAGSLILLVLVVAGTLWITHDRALNLIHPKRTLPEQTPNDYALANWETVQVPARDGLELTAWFIPPPMNSDGATLIFVHGYGGNRGGLLPQAALLMEQGYGALLIDLRNHGDSEGDRTTFGWLEVQDVQGALDYLLMRPEVNASRIGVVGESLGASTAIRAAALEPDIRAVVAQAAFSSLEDNVAEGVQRLTGLPPFPFAPLVLYFAEQEAGGRIGLVRPVNEIGAIAPRPILLMHGTDDPFIDVSNSQRLYDAAGEPRQLVLFDGAAHGRLLRADPDVFEQTVVPFLESALRGA